MEFVILPVVWGWITAAATFVADHFIVMFLIFMVAYFTRDLYHTVVEWWQYSAEEEE